MTTAGPGNPGCDFFVAHAGADAAVAARLAALLEAGGASVFLDVNEMLPGDVWPRVLAQAQDRSAITVILVSSNTAGAYYQLEELAEAIHMSRDTDRAHRVAPVYLEHVDRVPYGLRVLHGLWALDDAGVERAAGQLLRLLPSPGDQPAARLWSPLVPRVSQFFAGRDELLGRLAAQASRRTSVLAQTVAGLGGVGKTTVAAAWCWEQAEQADVVWWVRAETDATLVADLADLAAAMGLPDTCGEDLAARAEAACQALENERRRWLLVFDNADSDTLVHRFTPRRGTGRVIVTTRRRDFGRLGPVVDVEVFDPVIAEAFLRARTRDTNPAAAEEPAAADVARRLGGLPLALEQAGAYVAYSPLRSFTLYLELLDNAGLDPFIDGTPLDYQATATTTWQVSIDAAARRAYLAPKVMTAFAFLAAAPVPLVLFVELADHPYLASTSAEVTGAIEELYAYSLLTIDHKMLSVHRVVRDAARHLGVTAASSFVVDALVRLHPRDVDRPDTWARCAELRPHVLNIAATASVDDLAAATKIIWLLDRVGAALRYAGAAAQAVPVLEQAAELAVVVCGVDHPDTLASRNNLSDAYQEAGRITEAITLVEANLADRVRILGSDHRDVLTSRNNLALAYQAAGRKSEAMTILKSNLIDTERLLGPNHPNTLISRNNLAAAYEGAGRSAEAVTLHEANLIDTERLLGPDHPDTLTSRNNLALAYQEAGRSAEAVTLHEANLRDRERILGPDHPQTRTSRNNLIAAYQSAGRTGDAITLLRARRRREWQSPMT